MKGDSTQITALKRSSGDTLARLESELGCHDPSLDN